jgi:hypothetical protein
MILVLEGHGQQVACANHFVPIYDDGGNREHERDDR